MLTSRFVVVRLCASARFTNRRMQANAAEKPYGKPTTYRKSIWQGTPTPEPLKPEEFWPQKALAFKCNVGLSSKPQGRRILVGVGTTDWAGSVTALRTAFSVSSDKDEVLVFNAPKIIQDFQMNVMLAEGHKMGALVKMVQEVAREMKRPVPRIEMAPSTHQPKVEIMKKIVAEEADLVILGNGRYPPDSLGNVASYVALHAPCDVLLVKGGSQVV